MGNVAQMSSGCLLGRLSALGFVVIFLGGICRGTMLTSLPQFSFPLDWRCNGHDFFFRGDILVTGSKKVREDGSLVWCECARGRGVQSCALACPEKVREDRRLVWCECARGVRLCVLARPEKVREDGRLV